MKNLSLLLTSMALTVAFSGCEMLGDASQGGEMGRLCISFDESVSFVTKSDLSLPDTSEFLLSVTDKSGKSVYDGPFGDCPESLDLVPGSYNVRVVSMEFLKPAFNSPQFGDEQCVVVSKGESTYVKLMCTQLNAAVTLDVDSDFLTAYSGSVLFLKSAEGRLMYSYSERRPAYFLPGTVSVIMSSSGSEQVLMSRTLLPKQMVNIKVRVPSGAASSTSGISVSVDTARVWINDSCTIGESYKGTDQEEAYSVADARVLGGQEDVWVCGYIVGGDLTSSSASFVAPFESRTNILLGSRSVSSDKSTCLSVQLPAGDVREALNLVDNESLLGARVCVKGDLVDAYYGVPGMKNTSEYQIL